MQLFLSNIPASTKDFTLQDLIAERLHAPPIAAAHNGNPLNFNLRTFRPKRYAGGGYIPPFGRKQCRCGILIIPHKSAALRFLVSVTKHRIRINGNPISFHRDKKDQPEANHVRYLLGQPYDRTIAQRARLAEELEVPLDLHSIQFGLRSRKGEFVPEIAVCGPDFEPVSIWSRATLRLNAAKSVVFLESNWGMPELSTIAIPVRDILSIYLDDTLSANAPRDSSSALIICERSVVLSDRHYAYQEADYAESTDDDEDMDMDDVEDMAMDDAGDLTIPEARTGPDVSDDSDTLEVDWQDILKQRICAVPRSEAESPFVLREILIVGAGVVKFFSVLAKPQLFDLVPPERIKIIVNGTREYTPERLSSLSRQLAHFPIDCSYQFQKLLSNNLMKPAEINGILEDARRLLNDPRTSDLLEPTLRALAEDRSLAPPPLEATHRKHFKPVNVEERWAAALDSAKFNRRLQARGKPGLHSIGHVYITPTTMSLAGPLPDESNRVLRAYTGYHEYFLRVTFAEENALNRFWLTRSRYLVQNRFGSIMKDGLQLGGRRYEFLAYSQSSLKEYTVFFVHDFDKAGEHMHAEAIRNSLGDFTRIIRYPARYAARLSQAFTSTRDGVHIQAAKVERIPDVMRNGHNFSDGCGTISADLARQMMRKLYPSFKANAECISAFQVRLGGIKGMLFVDPGLQGEVLRIRESMEKFDASLSQALEVVEAHKESRMLLLNRPLVQALEHLGTPVHAFSIRQMAIVADVEHNTSSICKAAAFLDLRGIGKHFDLFGIFGALRSLQLEVQDLPAQLRAFIEDVLTTSRIDLLRQIKYECRLPVTGSYTLVGGFDESRELGPEEVCVCVTDSNTPGSGISYITGEIVVTRSPIFEPGNIRKVRCIGEPASPFLRAQRNAIIFSSKGEYPIHAACQGGDLDGDLYHVFTESARDLWPPSFSQPSECVKEPPLDLGRPCEMSDVADFVCKYIVSDLMGVIARRLMHIADQSNLAFDDFRCKDLARLASKSVAFAKSGNAVEGELIPKPDNWLLPDYLEQNHHDSHKKRSQFYCSDKALGRLYRDIELPRAGTKASVDRPNPDAPLIIADADRPAATEPCIERVQGHAERWLHGPFVPTVSEESCSRDLIDQCVSAFRRIAVAYKLRETKLCEAEIFTSTITGPRKIRNRKNLEKKVDMEIEHLLKTIRDELQPHHPGSTLVHEWRRSLRLTLMAFTKSCDRLDEFGVPSFCLFTIHQIMKITERLTALGG